MVGESRDSLASLDGSSKLTSSHHGGSHNGGVVDDVLGGVVSHVLLDRDLGHVLHLVVDLEHG